MTDIDLSDSYLTVSEVSEITKISKSTIYAHVRQGILSHLRIGRSIRIQGSDLEEYLAAHKVSRLYQISIRGGNNGYKTTK